MCEMKFRLAAAVVILIKTHNAGYINRNTIYSLAGETALYPSSAVSSPPGSHCRYNSGTATVHPADMVC